MLERIKDSYLRLLGLVDPDDGFSSDAEHHAVLELLLATEFVDGSVTEAEQEEVERFGEEHGWNGPTFSFGQALGEATSSVRRAKEGDGGLGSLLPVADERITTAAVRAEVADACLQVATADGATPEVESAWLAAVERTFGG